MNNTWINGSAELERIPLRFLPRAQKFRRHSQPASLPSYFIEQESAVNEAAIKISDDRITLSVSKLVSFGIPKHFALDWERKIEEYTKTTQDGNSNTQHICGKVSNTNNLRHMITDQTGGRTTERTLEEIFKRSQSLPGITPELYSLFNKTRSRRSSLSLFGTRLLSSKQSPLMLGNIATLPSSGRGQEAVPAVSTSSANASNKERRRSSNLTVM